MAAIHKASPPQRRQATADVFRAGYPAYLRLRTKEGEQMVLVYCQGVYAPTSMLRVQWSKEADAMGKPPKVDTDVICHVLYKGALYAASGRVVECSEGPLPLIELKVESTCAGVGLRSYQRYRVLGCLRINDPIENLQATQKSFEVMNLSRGGLGTTLPDNNWVIGKALEFSVKILAERDGAPVIEAPSLEFSGAMTVRRRGQPDQNGNLYMGFEFNELSDQHATVIESWLATCSVYLREE